MLTQNQFAAIVHRLQEVADEARDLGDEVEVLTAVVGAAVESLGRIGESDLVTLLTAERDAALQRIERLELRNAELSLTLHDIASHTDATVEEL